MQDFDVIIVGAGPAGSAAGILLGKKFRVLVLDKAVFPREKVCAGGLDIKAMGFLRQLGLLEKVESQARKIQGISVFKGSVFFSGIAPAHLKPNQGLCVERRILDELLFREAAKNCEAIEGFTVEKLVQKGSFVTGVFGRDAKGKCKEFSASIVLCSDGVFSVSSQVLPFAFNPNHEITAVRALVKNVKGLTDFIEIHLFDSIMPGYFWIFPLQNGFANVGLGMVTREMQRKGISLKERFFELIKTEATIRERFAGAVIVASPVGAKLPTIQRKKIFSNGLLLLGDAAGLVDPLTGEGISNAFESAFAASKAVENAFSKSDFSENSLREYASMLEPLRNDFFYSRLLQRIMCSFLFGFFVKKIASKKALASAFAGCFGGALPKKSFFSPRFLIELFF